MCRICRRRREAVDGRTLDLFVGGVLGGSVGVLLLGMTASLVLGRAFDAAGLVVGALTGLALVHLTPSLRAIARGFSGGPRL